MWHLHIAEVRCNQPAVATDAFECSVGCVPGEIIKSARTVEAPVRSLHVCLEDDGLFQGCILIIPSFWQGMFVVHKRIGLAIPSVSTTSARPKQIVIHEGMAFPGFSRQAMFYS